MEDALFLASQFMLNWAEITSAFVATGRIEGGLVPIHAQLGRDYKKPGQIVQFGWSQLSQFMLNWAEITRWTIELAEVDAWLSQFMLNWAEITRDAIVPYGRPINQSQFMLNWAEITRVASESCLTSNG